MATKHTPAPWNLQAREDGEHKYCPQILIAEARIVVRWSAGYHTPEEDVRMREEAFANARLIVAAPDLLGTLTKEAESLKREADWLEGHTRWDNRAVLELRLIESRMRAAIAKAEGRADG